MDSSSQAIKTHMSECQLYSTQFNKTMLESRIKILAAGATGGRNEVRFFEGPSLTADESEPSTLLGNFRATHRLDSFPGGVLSLDFSHKSNKIAVGTLEGFVASFRLRVSESMY